jgi:hypothetical protein
VVARARIIMLISALTTLLAIAAVITAIGCSAAAALWSQPTRLFRCPKARA